MKSILLKPDGPRCASQASVGRRCHERPLPAFALLLSLAFAAILLPVARGQEMTPPAHEKSQPIQIRVLCADIVPGEASISLLQKGEVAHDVDLTRGMVSDSLGFTRDEIVLARRAVAEGQNPAPLIRISLPDDGTRFVLALFPTSVADHERHYEHVLIRTDNLKFNTSDLLMMNRTEVSIGGTVGTRKISLAPKEMHVVTPDPPEGEWMYEVRFHHLRDGKPQLFSEARWPRTKSARVYLFFFPDPGKQSITYLSFREYAPYP